MNAKEEREKTKAAKDAKFTGTRTVQHTHTYTRNKVSKQKYILNQRKTSKQTNTQID